MELVSVVEAVLASVLVVVAGENCLALAEQSCRE